MEMLGPSGLGVSTSSPMREVSAPPAALLVKKQKPHGTSRRLLQLRRLAARGRGLPSPFTPGRPCYREVGARGEHEKRPLTEWLLWSAYLATTPGKTVKISALNAHGAKSRFLLVDRRRDVIDQSI